MKKNYTIRISQKIMGGILALIIIFILNAALGLLTLNRSAFIIKETSEVVDPSKDALNEFNLMVTNSRMYITNWVYLRANTEDKEALKKLIQTDYPLLKDRINQLKVSWKKDQQDNINLIFANFDTLLKAEKEIMSGMNSFEDYEDETLKFANQMRIDDEVLPKAKEIMTQLGSIIIKQKEETAKADEALLGSFDNLRTVTWGTSLLSIIVGLLVAFFLTKSITTPIRYIKNIIQQLGKGELPQDDKQKFDRDEIGEMADAVTKLVAGLRSTSSFAENIGKGNYQADYAPLSEKDVLGNALIDMRNNLEKVSEDDKKRNWATEGLAKFSEILRKNNDNINKLSDEILSNLVKYVKANQGGLFIVDDTESESFLELKACYAWDKKKYLEQKIYLGEGLTGQAWQEREIIYLTEVPQNYISITSGLGEANPKSILIVPLKVNEEIFGIVEMASFNEFAPHEIEFIEKIAESIASTISFAKTNERTQRLLEESTMMTEQMRAQEEEMRQNMEELQATQEEMQRAQRDAKLREDIFDSTQLIMELDNRFNVTYINSLVQSQLNFDNRELIGLSVETIFDSRSKFEQAKSQLTQGDVWSSLLHIKNKKGEKLLVKASAGSLSDHHQKDSKYLLILDNINELQNKI